MGERNFYKIMIGKNHAFAEDCVSGNFIGADWFKNEDLTNKFPVNGKTSTRSIFRSIYMKTQKIYGCCRISKWNVTYHL